MNLLHQFRACVLFSAARSLPNLTFFAPPTISIAYRLKLRSKNTGSYMYKHVLDMEFTGLETNMMPRRQRKPSQLGKCSKRRQIPRYRI